MEFSVHTTPSRTECYMRLAVYDLVGALFAPSDPAPARHSDKLFMRVRGDQDDVCGPTMQMSISVPAGLRART